MNRKAFATIAAAALSFVMIMSGPASATHQKIINDGTDPNSTKGPNGQNCSADAITPSGNYTITIGDYVYRLRWSLNCRSVWGRSANNAPRRNDMVAHRHTDSNSGGYCTTTRRFSGDTYTWTAQVDDRNHGSNVHINYSGYDDCVTSHAQFSTSLY